MRAVLALVLVSGCTCRAPVAGLPPAPPVAPAPSLPYVPGTELDYDTVEVSGPLTGVATEAEVDEAERTLGIRFPSGYRDYVTRFGTGILGGTLVHVYVPRRILSGPNGVAEWRARIDEYWFWDEGRDVLPRARVLEGVIVGDTMNGDELFVHPSFPNRIFVLPHEDEHIYVAGEGLRAALEWLCASGVLTEPFAERRFDPDP